MKNFVFLSPNFPANYWHFCRELKNDGFRVLGVGDCPYADLSRELKESLYEYYFVSSLENYDEVYRAMAFFAYKYGRIDWLESNNEYWLERDARLRSDFNIVSGFKSGDMEKVKYKSKMKPYYAAAGIKTAAYCLADSIETCKKFIATYGYPVIVKPDNGVGANDTHKIKDEEGLEQFFRTRLPLTYIMEEFVDAEVNSYDAIIDSRGVPIFETGNVTPMSIMDIVNNDDNSIFYIVNCPFDDVADLGRKTVKSFGVKSRFVHFEFFRLNCDQRLGKKGEVIGLEVNMRPSGGISPDMMNYANSVDVYKIWADMAAFDRTDLKAGERFYCAFAGRRDRKSFVYSDEKIAEKYKGNIRQVGRVADALSGAMGNRMYIATFREKADMDAFYRDVLLEK